MNVYLLAPIAVSAISAALAMIIYITDAIVNNYGTVTININNGKKNLPTKGGSPLLFSLAEENIFVPSACGGKGTCAACKVQVTSDAGPILPTEIPYMTSEELEQNIRLACQVKLKTDIDIIIPDALFNVRQYKARVEKIETVTHDIKDVTLSLPEGATINFVAGQYCQFQSEPYRKIKEKTFRAYSMSSPPHATNQVEFLIRLVPDGVVTTYVHDILKEGDTVVATGPFGEFHVRNTNASMICVAGGSGMAPFKSIFKEMIHDNTFDDRDIWYFFGAVKARDMYYLDWLRELDAKHKRFHFVPALSAPDEGDVWEGETGLITEVLDSYLRRDDLANVEKEGYLCGSPGMLDACMDVMRKNNMSDEKIYFDKFA